LVANLAKHAWTDDRTPASHAAAATVVKQSFFGGSAVISKCFQRPKAKVDIPESDPLQLQAVGGLCWRGDFEFADEIVVSVLRNAAD
jgi:hypothetical protein